MRLPRHDTTIIDVGSPMAVEANAAAAELYRASQSLMTKLRQPGETEADGRKNTIAHSLQAVIREASRAGADRGDLFTAMVVAVSLLLRDQPIASRVDYVSQLAMKAMLAAQMGDEAAQTGFPTAGEA